MIDSRKLCWDDVAVLIASNKDGLGLRRTLESVRDESSEVKIVLIDDGSPVSLMHYASDPNLEVVRLERNRGLTRALNIGLQRILDGGYAFVCRIDAGDENVPGRLREQIDYLHAHPQLSLVGAWAEYIDGHTGRSLFRYRPPIATDEVNKLLHRNSCIAHPTWMARAALFHQVGLYDESFVVAQDYELLRRAVSMGHAVGNVPKVLLKYQVDPTGISVSRRRAQLLSRLRIQWRHRRPFALSKAIGIGMTFVLLAVPRGIISAWKSRENA